MRGTLAKFALAAGLALGALALGENSASAMPAIDRGVATAVTETQGVTRAYWVCNPYRCWWRHRWHYWHPVYWHRYHYWHRWHRPYYWHRYHYWHRWHRWHHWHRYY
jgi:hypothetical protein